MYDFIRGKLIYIKGCSITVETHGVGYQMMIPIRYVDTLSSNEEICLFTAFVVREFSHTLYGFFQREERDLFEMLIELSGIGPKTALNILGHLDMSSFHEIIAMQNHSALSKIPGIGKKTAERLIIDLKGKWQATANFSLDTKLQDALSALMNLGYSQKKAEIALKKAKESLPSDCEIGDLIKNALKT